MQALYGISLRSYKLPSFESLQVISLSLSQVPLDTSSHMVGHLVVFVPVVFWWAVGSLALIWAVGVGAGPFLFLFVRVSNGRRPGLVRSVALTGSHVLLLPHLVGISCQWLRFTLGEFWRET
jgi:hypothetical protein